MREVEEKIAAWREQSASAGITRAEVLDELESHLREELEAQERAGVAPQRAFEMAVQRLGQPAALKNEFAQAGGARDAHIRRALGRVLAFGAGGFAAGAGFCYFVVLPWVGAASQQYAAWLGTGGPPGSASRAGFVCKLVFGFGAAFALPAGLSALTKMGVLDYRRLSALRRHVIVFNLILGALLTTPEVVTQLMMFVPLQLIYEAAVWIAWHSQRKRIKCA